MEEILRVNPGKNRIIENDGDKWECLAIRTHIVTDKDNIIDVAQKYASPILKSGDILFMSEKMVACTQGRAYPLDTIKPRFMAKVLSRFVVKTDYGIGLAMPETMEMAFRECGAFRILLAAFCGAVGKLFRKKGWFYVVAGYKAAAVDGPCEFTIPPYNKCVVLAPENPEKVCKEVAEALGNDIKVMVVDINDLGGQILGFSEENADLDYYCRLLKQNPLGQDDEQTPMGLLRKAENNGTQEHQ